MSEILNIRATTVLKNVNHNQPVLSVIGRQPLILIDPSYINGSNGQQVSSFVALGSYTEYQKTFNNKYSSNYPTYKQNGLNGFPCLSFDKNSNITTALNIAAPHDGKPIVKVQVWKFDRANLGSHPRIWATSVNAPSRAAEMLLATGIRLDGASDKSITVNNTESYTIMIEYFNGTNSKFILNGTMATGELTLPTQPFEVFTLGRWYGITASDASLTGEMYYGAMYSGETTDNELTLLYNDVAQRFGLNKI